MRVGRANQTSASKEAFCNHYSIYNERSSIKKWETKSIEQKLKTIVDYLMECRRNKYTHAAEIFPAFGGIRESRRRLMDGNASLPEAISQVVAWKNKRYSITCNYGDEALMLREIILACLAHEFGVLDREWINRYRVAETQFRYHTNNPNMLSGSAPIASSGSRP